MRTAAGISHQGEHMIQDFISALEHDKYLTPKTLKEYASDLKHFMAWYEALAHQAAAAETYFRMEDVTTTQLLRYRESAQNEMELKPATINRRLVTLKRFFGWAVAEAKIRRDPSKSVKLVPEAKASPRQINDHEEAQLIAAAEQSGSLRDLTILIVMLHTGLRTMEVCDLVIEDIQLDIPDSQLTVRSGKRNKQREIPLNAVCRAVLEKYSAELPPDSKYLFPSYKTGDRLTERALRHMVHKYVKAANLEGLSAHDLRHRFGYVMAESTPLQRLAQIMGHDRLDSTMIYFKAVHEDHGDRTAI